MEESGYCHLSHTSKLCRVTRGKRQQMETSWVECNKMREESCRYPSIITRYRFLNLVIEMYHADAGKETNRCFCMGVKTVDHANSAARTEANTTALFRATSARKRCALVSRQRRRRLSPSCRRSGVQGDGAWTHLSTEASVVATRSCLRIRSIRDECKVDRAECPPACAIAHVSIADITVRS